jgi:hypothetical protein
MASISHSFAIELKRHAHPQNVHQKLVDPQLLVHLSLSISLSLSFFFPSDQISSSFSLPCCMISSSSIWAGKDPSISHVLRVMTQDEWIEDTNG